VKITCNLRYSKRKIYTKILVVYAR